MREIVKEQNNLLHQKCEVATDFEEAKKIADELLIVVRSKAKFWNRFLGFAANQIGYNKRVIVLRNGTDNYDVLVNPTFIQKQLPFLYIENCFSLDLKHYYFVKRYLWSKVKYQDLWGIYHEKVFRGFSGVYQEIDHIEGVLISDIGWRVF